MEELKYQQNTSASNELSELDALQQLSEDDLDNVSGGMSLNFGDIENFAQNSGSFFEQTNLSVDQATFAGPNGSGTVSSIDFQQIKSGAFQNIGIS